MLRGYCSLITIFNSNYVKIPEFMYGKRKKRGKNIKKNINLDKKSRKISFYRKSFPEKKR